MREQLTALRREMAKRGIDAYIISTTDFHGSEYVNEYFKCRQYVSGFTGSAGTLLVTGEWAGLWTDGRYFLQAAAQLAGSGIELMKMNHAGVPALEDWLEQNLAAGSTVGFDGRIVDLACGRRLEKTFRLKYDEDLVGEIWLTRPKLCGNRIWALPQSATGESSESKLERLRRAMAEKGADYHLITRLEEIAWLYNLRGSDVAHTPVFFAFALISRDEDRLYVLDESFAGKKTRPYFEVFRDLGELPPGRILLDTASVSYTLVRLLPPQVTIIDAPDPLEAMKAVKNSTEIRCSENAHLKDGLAMVNFIYWLKSNIGKIEMSEISAADYLEAARREQPGCFDLSFATISGYMENGAIVHYAPTAESNKKLAPRGFLLVDSGGQYEDGTTDITRTIALGPLTQEMKEDYTTVIKAHLALAMAVFARGTSGKELDEVARRPLWARGLDFDHGTGHGVGHILSVHEGPNRIAPRGSDWPILPGMITTDEPGVYKEGKYGIRLENELLCVESAKLLAFRPLTLCPFDREAIVPEMLTAEELAYLNSYQQAVCEILAPLLEPQAAAWLREETARIVKK